MMKLIAVSAISFILATGCSNQGQQRVEAAPLAGGTNSFFVGVDTSKLQEPTRTAVLSAEKDIDLVLRGRPPACKDSPDSADSDGGTAYYKCEHYDLTVMRSLYKLGNVHGYLYGPIVTIHENYPISYVRFYSGEQLEALLKQGGVWR